MSPAPPPFRRLEGLRISNVYVLDGGPGDRWLVDTGHPVERVALVSGLRRAGLRPSDLRGVLLTHRHSDHAGNALFLRRRYGLRIHAHRADAEVLGGAAPRPRMPLGGGSLVAGLFACLENLWPARVEVDRALDDGDVVAGLEVHWVPGHTAGSVFYRHEPGRTLISGDMLVTAVPPLTLREGLCLPYPTFTWDMARARASLGAFHARGLAYDHLLAGHGPPLVGGARARVGRLLEESGIGAGGARERPAP